jgi:hypothetical protein
VESSAWAQVCRGSVLGGIKEAVASLSLMDRNGRKRMVLQVTPDGTPSIAFLDADGTIVNHARIGARDGKEDGEHGEGTATLNHLTSREPEAGTL